MTASCSHSCCRQDFLPLACGLLPAEGREVACETPAAAALRGCGCVAQATALDLTGVEAQPAWPYQPTHSAPSSTGRLPRCAMYGATSKRTSNGDPLNASHPYTPCRYALLTHHGRARVCLHKAATGSLARNGGSMPGSPVQGQRHQYIL
jgi:hypothetical protein